MALRYDVEIGGVTYPKVLVARGSKAVKNETSTILITLSDPARAAYDVISFGQEILVTDSTTSAKILGGTVKTTGYNQQKKYRLTINGVGYTAVLSQKKVDAQIYLEGREESVIVRDVMHNYVMRTKLIDNMEATSGWAVADDWSGLTTSTTENRLGTACLEMSQTYSGGTGTLTKTISAFDLAATDYLTVYGEFTAANQGTDLRINFGQDSSNYFTVTVPFANIDFTLGGGWQYVEFDVTTRTTGAGSPTLTGITWIQFDADVNASSSGNTIRFDDLRRVPHTSNDITLSKVITTTTTFGPIQIYNQYVSRFFRDEVAMKNGKTFFIDLDKVLNWHAPGSSSSGESLTKGIDIIAADFKEDSAKTINDLQVLGGRQLFQAQEIFSGTGAQTVFSLTREPVDIKVTVDGVIQTGYLKDQTETFDYSVKQKEKDVTFESGSIPSDDTDNVVFDYSYGVAVIVQKKIPQDTVFSEIDGKIENPNVTTRDEARAILQQQLLLQGNPTNSGVVVSKLKPSVDVSETIPVDHDGYFDTPTTFEVVKIDQIVIGGKPRSVMSLADTRLSSIDLLRDIYSRLNSQEEKDRSQSDIIEKGIDEGDDLALTDDPASNLSVRVRSDALASFKFITPPDFSVTSTITFGGGSAGFGSNLITNPSP